MSKMCTTEKHNVKGYKGEVWIWHLRGVIKYADCAHVRMKSDKLLALRPKKELRSKAVIVDLSEAKSLDSTAYGVLTGYGKHANLLGDEVIFVASGKVLEFMRASRLDTSLTIAKSVEDAEKLLVLTVQ